MADDNTTLLNTEQTRKPHTGPTTWKPGMPSPNPNGRPKKGTALTDVMREMLEGTPDIKKAIMSRLLKGAADGDIAFIREVLDRLEGKPQVTADIHNTGEVVVIPQEVYNKYGATQDTTDSGEQQKKV